MAVDKMIIEKLEEEYIRYIKTIRCCEDVDENFIFAGTTDDGYGNEYEGYDDYSDYSDD